MSWLFSQALVEEFSEDTSWDGRPSAQLSVMPTPHKFWRGDKTIKPSDHSRFGLTSEVLTVDHGEALLTSFLAASRARTSARPARASASTACVPDSGHRWRALLARFDPGSSTWRTAQSSLLEDLDVFSETWPRLGSMRNGESFLRRTLELPTFENGFGYWPTPTVWGNHNQPGASETSGWGLSSAVKLWPTPAASDNHDRKPSKNVHITASGLPKHVSENGQLSQMRLGQAVQLWPTPMASDWRSGQTSQATAEKNSRPLREAVVRETFRTPNASDADKWSHQTQAQREAKGQQVRLTNQLEAGGALNPTWVEWLMGWPIGWTDLKPLEMDKFREWQRQHSQHFEGGDES